MDLSRELASTQLWDCHGHVTHTLTLLPDGTVQVVIGSVTSVVDPTRRVVLRPNSYSVPDQVYDYAAILARDALR